MYKQSSHAVSKIKISEKNKQSELQSNKTFEASPMPQPKM